MDSTSIFAQAHPANEQRVWDAVYAKKPQAVSGAGTKVLQIEVFRAFESQRVEYYKLTPSPKWLPWFAVAVEGMLFLKTQANHSSHSGTTPSGGGATAIEN